MSGDVYFVPIGKLPEGLEKIEHNGRFICERGEQSNHNHTIVAERASDVEIFKDKNGRLYFKVLSDNVKCGHFIGEDINTTADHKTIPLERKIYKQIKERELDFGTAIERKTQD